MSVGVIVGRFQLNDPHDGHRVLLGKLSPFQTRIVFIGVPRKDADGTDPLPFMAVRHGVETALMCQYVHNVVILPLLDHPSNDEWSKELDRQIQLVSGQPLDAVTFIHGRDSFIKHYTGGVTKSLMVNTHPDCSATKVRETLKNAPSFKEELFRRGVIWARTNDRPRPLATVDICIKVKQKNGVSEIIFIKKKDEDKWRLPGGFVEVGEALETAVRREAREECGDVEISDPKFLASFVVDDWRLRKSPHKILTSLFVSDYVFGHFKAGDDAHMLKSVPAQFVELDWIVPEHHPLIRTLYHNQIVALPSWQVEAK